MKESHRPIDNLGHLFYIVPAVVPGIVPGIALGAANRSLEPSTFCRTR